MKLHNLTIIVDYFYFKNHILGSIPWRVSYPSQFHQGFHVFCWSKTHIILSQIKHPTNKPPSKLRLLIIYNSTSCKIHVWICMWLPCVYRYGHQLNSWHLMRWIKFKYNLSGVFPLPIEGFHPPSNTFTMINTKFTTLVVHKILKMPLKILNFPYCPSLVFPWYRSFIHTKKWHPLWSIEREREVLRKKNKWEPYGCLGHLYITIFTKHHIWRNSLIWITRGLLAKRCKECKIIVNKTSFNESFLGWHMYQVIEWSRECKMR